MWDFQGAGLSPEHVPFWWGLMKEYLTAKFREATARWLLRAFTSPEQATAEDRLGKEGFRIRTDNDDMGDDLIPQCRTDCGEDPEATVLVLVAGDGERSELIEEMLGKGVEVYVWASDEASADMRSAVDAEHWIPWKEPYVVAAFLVLIGNLGGQQITRAQFRNECRKLVREQPYFDPTAIGFRRRNPYGALLDWLAEHGFVDLRSERDNPNFISVVRRA